VLETCQRANNQHAKCLQCIHFGLLTPTRSTSFRWSSHEHQTLALHCANHHWLFLFSIGIWRCPSPLLWPNASKLAFYLWWLSCPFQTIQQQTFSRGRCQQKRIVPLEPKCQTPWHIGSKISLTPWPTLAANSYVVFPCKTKNTMQAVSWLASPVSLIVLIRCNTWGLCLCC